ncbi:hypothetical protein Misp01_78240 [Microtetraspora sp. NBRC 13810]|nr:hypothetical protein Misp01_78240 [Microtetraspora sp. NBRC 13810]
MERRYEPLVEVSDEPHVPGQSRLSATYRPTAYLPRRGAGAWQSAPVTGWESEPAVAPATSPAWPASTGAGRSFSSDEGLYDLGDLSHEIPEIADEILDGGGSIAEWSGA